MVVVVVLEAVVRNGSVLVFIIRSFEHVSWHSVSVEDVRETTCAVQAKRLQYVSFTVFVPCKSGLVAS